MPRGEACRLARGAVRRWGGLRGARRGTLTASSRGVVALLSLLILVGISIVVTRFATETLVQTGMPRESAKFQARSALTGVGFTTSEAEAVVNHPVRRRVILLLMLAGNVGIVSILASLILTFVGQEPAWEWPVKIGVLVAGAAGLWWFSQSKVVARGLGQMIKRALVRFTDLDVSDYRGLLHVSEQYTIAQFDVEEGDWVATKTLAELHLRDENVVVLGIERKDGDYVAAPDGDTRIVPGDQLLLYGHHDQLRELDERRGESGDRAHQEAVREVDRRIEEEKRREHERGELSV